MDRATDPPGPAVSPAIDLTWISSVDDPSLETLHEQLYALLDDFAPLAIHEHESADGWRVFFRTRVQRDAAIVAIRSAADARLSLVTPIDVVDDEWARRSQANLTPIKVGRIVVTPPWHAAAVLPPKGGSYGKQRRNEIVLVIDPSTGFGTGHHETTRLCLSLLQDLELNERHVIDVGTGSGVLAIAAALLGASSVLAFDEDPEALRNARENAARNGVSERVHVREAALDTFAHEPAAVVLANITAGVLQKHAARLAALVEPGGRLIASGFSDAEIDDVAAAFAFEIERRSIEGDWAALMLLRSGG